MAGSNVNIQSGRAIFITGNVSIGKTTLVKTVVTALKREKVPFHGFITEEVRRNGHRVGFDAILVSSDDLKGNEVERVSLAKVADEAHSVGPRVGKYVVDINSFESLMGTALHQKAAGGHKSVIVIDEIGKMELFSQRFKDDVHSILSNPNAVVLATVPIKPVSFVDQLRSKYQIRQFIVTIDNRNNLSHEIVSAIKQMMK
ncbi:hypothetical protein CHUAL_005789 [Chamberlinius hualienensis]